MSCLLDEVRSRSQLNDYIFRTEAIYLYWIGRYIHANDRWHLHEFDGAAERSFSQLAEDKHGALASLRNQIEPEKRTKAPSESG